MTSITLRGSRRRVRLHRCGHDSTGEREVRHAPATVQEVETALAHEPRGAPLARVGAVQSGTAQAPGPLCAFCGQDAAGVRGAAPRGGGVQVRLLRPRCGRGLVVERPRGGGGRAIGGPRKPRSASIWGSRPPPRAAMGSGSRRVGSTAASSRRSPRRSAVLIGAKPSDCTVRQRAAAMTPCTDFPVN